MVVEAEPADASDEDDEAQMNSPISQRRLAERAAAEAAAATAAVMTAAATADGEPCTPPAARAGGARWSGAGKARARTIASSTPIKPAREGERRAMVASLTEAREVHGADSDAMYSRAAQLYLQRVELAYSDRSHAPDASSMRPNPTSAELLKEVCEGSVRYAMRVEEERARGGSSSDPILALPTPTALPSPTGGTSPVATTAATVVTAAAPPVDAQVRPVAFDFTRALVPPSKGEVALQKQRARNAAQAVKNKGAMVVHRDAIKGIGKHSRVTTQILQRVARYLDVQYKRTADNGKTWDTVRDDVLATWPAERETVELEAAS